MKEKTQKEKVMELAFKPFPQFGKVSSVRDSVNTVKPEPELEPKVIKGRPKTLDAWISWKVSNDGYDPLKDFLPYGYQTELIGLTFGFGYKDDTVVKKACKRLRLQFAKR